MGNFSRLQLAAYLSLAFHVGPLRAQVVVLPGCQAISKAGQSSSRDYSQPASRLVGRWATLDGASFAAACNYFGSIDKETGVGLYVSYFLQTKNPQTGQFTVIPGGATPPDSATLAKIEGWYR